MALILAMGTYGAGYVARIVGAFIFGKMGDRIGRKSALYYHHHDGDLYHLNWCVTDLCTDWCFAPILLVTLRIIQGWVQVRKFPVPVRCWRNMRQKVSAELSPHLWLWELTAEP